MAPRLAGADQDRLETLSLQLPLEVEEGASLIRIVLVDDQQVVPHWHEERAARGCGLCGDMLTVGGFRRTFQRAAARAGLGHLSPNDLRHSAASFAIAHGANVYDVQRMLGHARPSITLDVYGELFEEQHSRFIDHLDEVIRRSRAEAPPEVETASAG